MNTNSTRRKQMLSRFDDINTPVYAIEPLRDLLELKFRYKTVWEPCWVSDSNIVNVFEDIGKTVKITGLLRGEDYLKYEPEFDYDIMITNPPYSIKDKFLKRAFELRKPFAFLLPVDAVCGIRRHKMFRDNCVSILALNGRIDFTGSGNPHTFSIWLIGNLWFENQFFLGEIVKP